MTRARSRAAWCAGALLLTTALLSTSAASAPAAGSMTVIQRLTLTYAGELSFGRLHTDNGHGNGTVTVKPGKVVTRTAVNAHLMSSAFAPGTTTVTGEPGRLYRITLPSGVRTTPGGLAVGGFTVWSDVRGDVTASGIGQIGPDGKDTVRVGATVTVPAKTKVQTFTAETPITVSYE